MIIEPVFEGELEIGRFYMVPTVWGPLNSRWDNWPVLGPAHEDSEIIDFPREHYHLDFRFFNPAQWNFIAGFEIYVHAWVLHWRGDYLELGPVVFRRRKCYRQMPVFPREASFGRRAKWLPHLEAAYADAALKPGLICPHRGASLRGLPVDERGCVVCPLHGLKWDLSTGRLVPEGSK